MQTVQDHPQTELTHNRDFDIYAEQMDASMGQKLKDILPWVKHDTIADVGCGTGLMLKVMAKLFKDDKLIGVETSPTLFKVAQDNLSECGNVLLANLNVKDMPPTPNDAEGGVIDTIIYSSVMHEIYSYSDYSEDAVRQQLVKAWADLKPGGRLIIRDGVKPPDILVWAKFDDNTEDKFASFRNGFKRIHDYPGTTSIVFDGDLYCKISLPLLNEFLSKKDYLANWDQEMHEVFGFWDVKRWNWELVTSGFKVVHNEAYLNPWIYQNRYLSKVEIFGGTDKPEVKIGYPATNIVLAAEKVA